MLSALKRLFGRNATAFFADTDTATQHRGAPSKPLTVAERRRMAQRPPSFTELLPWTRFAADDEAFWLSDGTSVAAVFEITPAPSEAMPDDVMADRAHKVLAALKSIPECEEGEWVLQVFVADDHNLEELMPEFVDYIRRAHADDSARGEAVLQSEFTQAWLKELGAHVTNVSRPQGLFLDTEVSGNIWRGQQRRVRCVLYRKYPMSYKPGPNDPSAIEALNSAAEGLLAGLHEADVHARRCHGQDLYEWLLPFFNRPAGVRPAQLLKDAPYPGDQAATAPGQAPLFGFDLAEMINLSAPESDLALGAWRFDGVYVKAMTLQQITQQPTIGHITAERRYAEKHFARFDRLPPGCMLSMTVVVKGQHLVRDHVERIQTASRAQNADAAQTWAEAERVLNEMASTGDKLVPFFCTLYVSGATTEDLRRKISAVTAQLTPAGLRFIDPGSDLAPLDSFVRGLPMGFDPAFDARKLKRSRLVFMSQIASLLPVYGRHRGTGRPGMWFWNRGGEPLLVDPLNKQDRRKNAHMLTFGPTGAGKSATLNYQCMNVMAIYRPRLVIIDAGASFALLVQHFASLGLSTHTVRFTPDADVSLPPFALAPKVLADTAVMDSFRAAERAGGAESGDVAAALVSSVNDLEAAPAAVNEDDVDDKEEKRDILGEMLFSAILMITGGEDKELERLGRADRYLITRAIIRAAVASQKAGTAHPLTHDVALELTQMRNDPGLSVSRRERAEEMGQAMLSFCSDLRARIFDRYGTPWPDVDVTLVEMGTLANEGYGDALAIAYSNLLDAVQSRSEANQYEGRHTIVLTDEGHLVTTNALLGPKIARGTKMWRKLFTWFWMATQNMHDFPGSMSRVLSMCEWWLLLTMERAEIDDVARFKTLTREQQLMIESARKEPGKYTEGVLLSAKGQMLMRNVSPPLAIALAMTEGEEKAERRRIMRDLGCDELGAAVEVARRIACRDQLKAPSKKREPTHA